MDIPANRRYTTDHEWAMEKDGVVYIGITEYAQQELGDVVFVELPTVGGKVTKGNSFSSVESVKAVSEVYAPLSGEVSKVNSELESSPDLINSSPYENGWLVAISGVSSTELSSLMDSNAYAAHLSGISK